LVGWFRATDYASRDGVLRTQFESHGHERLGSEMDKFLDCADAPANVESASFVDRAGFTNLLLSAYWTDPASYETWKDKSGFVAWWSDQTVSMIGKGIFARYLRCRQTDSRPSSATITWSA